MAADNKKTSTAELVTASDYADDCRRLASKERLRQRVMDVLRARDESPASKRNSRLWDADDLIQTVLAFDGKHRESARLRRALGAEVTECERCATTDAADEGLHLSANNIF